MTSDALRVEQWWRDAIRPEPQLTVSEWADRHRILPPQSAEPGRWRTSRVPYLREVQDCLSVSSPFERVVFVKGAQIGGTEAGLNWCGYAIHHAPGTMLMVQPSLDAIKRNTTTRLDPLIEHCPAIRDLVAEKRSRDTGNSMFRKAFPGGELICVGAQSGIGLRSLPARYLFMDEVDAFPNDVDGEGDPVALAVQRTVTYRGRRKIYLVSTPTLKGFSRIEKAYLESDQRRYFVPCPQCGEFHIIEWSQIQWPEGRRAEACRVCPGCGGIAEEKHKPSMLANGEWRATAEGDGTTVGFHLSSLYSPFETWADVAVEHGRVHRDPARLKSFINTKLGETWEDRSAEGADTAALLNRREALHPLPAGVVYLTAGIDTQQNRLEVTITGWGRGEESWVIRHVILWGDPQGSQVWQDLDALLAETYPHVKAVPDLTVRAACIDSGGSNTTAVYNYARTRHAKRIWAIKGKNENSGPIWPKKPSKPKAGVIMYAINSVAGKETLYARLANNAPGPGYIHLSSDLTDAYMQQLTAEKVKTVYRKGHPVREWWLPSGVRNEGLDCYVYSLAALHGLYAMGMSLDREAALLDTMPLRSETSAPVAVPPPRQLRPTRSRYLYGDA